MTLSEGAGWTYDHEEFVKFDKEIMSKAVATEATRKDGPTPVVIHKAPKLVKYGKDGHIIELKSPLNTKRERSGKSSIKKVIKRDRTAFYVTTEK